MIQRHVAVLTRVARMYLRAQNGMGLSPQQILNPKRDPCCLLRVNI